MPLQDFKVASPSFCEVNNANIDILEVKEGEFDYDISALDCEEFPVQNNLNEDRKFLRKASLVVNDYFKLETK